MDDLREPLVGDWSLRKLAVAGRPEWALQYKGMDWIKITEFLGTGNPTLDDEMKQFAADLRAAVEAERAENERLLAALAQSASPPDDAA